MSDSDMKKYIDLLKEMGLTPEIIGPDDGYADHKPTEFKEESLDEDLIKGVILHDLSEHVNGNSGYGCIMYFYGEEERFVGAWTGYV